jgi:hypothetical protein
MLPLFLSLAAGNSCFKVRQPRSDAIKVFGHYWAPCQQRLSGTKVEVAMPKMIVSLIMLLIVAPTTTLAQNLTVSEWIDQFVDMCVGGGSSTITSGSGDANVGITLRSLSISGEIKGQVSLSKQQFRLLSEGINNKMSEVAAAQADKIRSCLEPVRRQMLAVMSAQFGVEPGRNANIEILSPDEDKIMRVLAVTPGRAGEVGKLVPAVTIKQKTGLGDIRYRAAFRSLQTKLLATNLDFTGDPVGFIWERGEEYVLKMGYAN